MTIHTEPPANASQTAAPHRIERVRHETRRRVLTVTATARLSPGMIRITLGGPELDGFASLGFDDHVKIFLPRPGEDRPYVPAGAPGDRLADGAEKPIARDFTPRRYDAEAGTLDIDFALHEAGPATEWAARARPGMELGIGGPRGSFVVADDFDWYLLIGDDTALPAIGRFLDEVRPEARCLVLAEVADKTEELPLRSRAALDLRWIHRAGEVGEGTGLEAELAALALPAGDGFVWIAGEAELAKRRRRIVVERHGHPKAWVKAAGYWRRGSANVHETISD